MINDTVTPVRRYADSPIRGPLAFVAFLVCAFAYVILKDAGFSRMLVTIVALAGGVAYGLAVRPWGTMLIYFLTAYLPFSKQVPVDFGGALPGLNLTNILVGLTALACWRSRAKNVEGILRIPLNLPLVLFFALGLVSILRGAAYGGGYLAEAFIQYYRKWAVPLILYFLVVNMVRDRETLKNLVIIIGMAATMAALMAAYEYWDTEERVRGIMDQPNHLASFFSYYMFLPLGFLLVYHQERRSWWLVVPFLIFLRGIMVTFSRAGYLAVLAGLCAVTFFKSKRLFLLLLFAAWFVFQNPGLLPEGIRWRLAQTLERPTTVHETGVRVGQEYLDKSSSDRIKIWEGAMWMIREHPLFGIGYNLFESKILHYWPGSKSHDPHNTYLLIASEMGIPSLLLFLWILWRIFTASRTLYKTGQDPLAKALALGFLGGFFALLTANIYGSRLTYPEVSSYFWILTALIMRMNVEMGLPHE